MDFKELARRAVQNPDSLSKEELQFVIANPAGEVELSDEELGSVAGGMDSTEKLMTLGCCGGYTNMPTTCMEGGCIAPS